MIIAEKWLDAEDILKGILAWAEIESPSYHVAGVNRIMVLAEAEMADLGADVTRIPGAEGYGDIVVAKFSNGAEIDVPGVLILSHLDTVHELGTLDTHLKIRRDGEKVFGPGVLDMKGGVRLGVEAFKALRSAGLTPKLPLTFMFTPDEEIGSPFARPHIEAEAQKNRYILVPEPLRPWGDIVTGRHAIQRYFVKTIGKPSHAGLTKREGRSAIAQMARIISRIEEMNDHDREMTYAVGKVHGGTFVNVVAIECLAEVLCVAPSVERLEEVRANMRALAGEEDGVRTEVEQGLLRPVSLPHDGTMALYEIARSIAAEIGIDLTHCRSGGGSDGNFTGALGLPTLDGLGVAGAGAHTFGEHLLVSSLLPRCRLLAGLLGTLG